MTANKTPTIFEKIKYSLYSAIVFLIIASPFMYGVTSSIFGKWVAVKGCPTIAGLVLHTIVFALVVLGIMYLPLP